MSPATNPSRPALVEALQAPEFEEMLPRLVAYAARRLRRVGWGEGRDHRPAAADVEEVVHTAVESALAGERVWPDDIDLETFLRGIIWSQVEHRYAKAKRERRTKSSIEADAEDRAAPADVAHARIELLASIERAIADDAELTALYRAMANGGETPRERARALGWTVEHERNVHKRMNRRLAAASLVPEPGDVGPQALQQGGRWNRPSFGDDP